MKPKSNQFDLKLRSPLKRYSPHESIVSSGYSATVPNSSNTRNRDHIPISPRCNWPDRRTSSPYFPPYFPWISRRTLRRDWGTHLYLLSKVWGYISKDHQYKDYNIRQNQSQKLRQPEMILIHHWSLRIDWNCLFIWTYQNNEAVGYLHVFRPNTLLLLNHEIIGLFIKMGISVNFVHAYSW